ncbi:PA2778 family cysteine peptidase [Aliiglaciecola sp. 2_MG-2023]|uniref:PA2778 family cysteine peptidase n=1 Tax=unclassified Aliiglaciecola TaxID=2593648 RepID=UPI0026E29551|nr:MULTISPECIES: PA2778 family cysteine peptidase [unclassified Aliiglaciecola]MDO6711312.1 PA2778 family cysteine peptidase [Aliiglaciecola sp. 2_MG-2023]MDO6752239.1 PA2778 family cysteine peptidase [Aliiglaciecola sp. 1_MG-2023]
MKNITLVVQWLLLVGAFWLTGCQSTPQADALQASAPTDIPSQKNLDDVPFYPQQEFYCGPTTLSEVFAYYGEQVSAEDIAPKLFIPEKEGSLQLEMVSAARQYGYLAYSGRGNLEQLLYSIEHDVPVIVFQNQSISWLPMWHYALVTGYDLDSQTIQLHTGVTESHTMSFELFERLWQRGNYWYLMPLPAGLTHNNLDAFKYTSAAFDMLQTGQVEAGLTNLIAATKQWPEQWLGYFLLANHFAEFDYQQANQWFFKGWQYGKDQGAYLNNYAYSLANQGCPVQTRQLMEYALDKFPDDDLLKRSYAELLTETTDTKTPENTSGAQCQLPSLVD